MRLEDHFLLSRYFRHLLGADSFDDVKSLLRNADEGPDYDGQSHFLGQLLQRDVPVPEDDLRRYDRRVMEYEARLAKARGEFEGFRYFQYLSLLYAEIFLDRLTADPAGLREELTVQDLRKLEGVGTAKACLIVAALELARRYVGEKGRVIDEIEDLLPLIGHIADEKQEHFLCVTLTGAGEVIAKRLITVGLLDSSQVHPREVFADALTDRAAGLLLAHNHPNGILEPSAEDIEFTRRLVDAGMLLGVEVVDHVIVTTKGWVSMRREGRFPL